MLGLSTRIFVIRKIVQNNHLYCDSYSLGTGAFQLIRTFMRLLKITVHGKSYAYASFTTNTDNMGGSKLIECFG